MTKTSGGVGATAGLVDPADCPSAAVDGVVRSVLVDAGAETGRTHGEGHDDNWIRLAGGFRTMDEEARIEVLGAVRYRPCSLETQTPAE